MVLKTEPKLILAKERKPDNLAIQKLPYRVRRGYLTKKDLVALADALRIHNQTADGRTEFTPDHLVVLADFCASQDLNFNRKRWMDNITGEGGPGDELMFVKTDSAVIPMPPCRVRGFRPSS